MNIAENAELCCGCMACAQVCPCHAVSETENEKGFLIPQINLNQCIHCGACRKVCPVNDKRMIPELPDQRIYGGWLKSEKARRESRSGGAFTAFAEVVLSKTGTVYGVELDSDYFVKYTRVSHRDELYRLKGSKYVQAYTGDIFSRVRADLQEGKIVLFGGTPCHIDGLLHFIPKREQEKLVTCDLVCHGVPSPAVFRDYINYILQRRGEIENFQFRDKKKGWHSHYESYHIKPTGKEYAGVYAELFYSCLIFRESCYHCRYASYGRLSDLTAADFWGIERTHPECDDDKGYSLILVNSSKGKEIFEDAKQYLNFFETDRASCTQPNLLRPSEKNTGKAERFWNRYRKKGFSYIVRKYTSVNPKKRIWRKLRRLGMKK